MILYNHFDMLKLAQVHHDDISNVLILNKKSISNQEQQLFQAELDKFRPHQNRLLQASHKQTALMKELTKTFSTLLQDKRVKSEQTKHENFTKQKNIVLTKYRKVFQAFNDLVDGLVRAQNFYSEMRETIHSLEKNVESFVNNRRSEGGQLLNQIERDKQNRAGGQADRERDRLRDLMERMSTDPSIDSSTHKLSLGSISTAPRDSLPNELNLGKSPPMSPPQPQQPTVYNKSGTARSPESNFPINPYHHDHILEGSRQSIGAIPTTSSNYNPMMYPYQSPALPSQQNYVQQPQLGQQQQYRNLPQGYVPPPPPPGPPPNSQGSYGFSEISHPSGLGSYASHQPPRPGSTTSQQNDLWAGLNAWK